jgi:hypothetical protein
MVARVEEAINISGLPLKIEIVDSLDEMMKYPTWILPTLVINEKVTARGYVPSVNIILEQLKTNNSNTQI